MDFETVTQDKKTIFAVTRAIQIIGEAVKKVPSNITVKYSDIPWQLSHVLENQAIALSYSAKLKEAGATVVIDNVEKLTTELIENLF